MGHLTDPTSAIWRLVGVPLLPPCELLWHLRSPPMRTRRAGAASSSHLKERGLRGVRLIISDARIGLSESAATAWQRCIVHWYRNIFSRVPSTKVREIAAILKAIHAGEDIVAARQKAVQVIEKMRGLRLINAAELVAMAY
jgi:transposase-like protein